MVTYGTTVIPSDQITVLEGGAVSVSVAFDNSVGLVGGMDTDNGTATTGEVQSVRSAPEAAELYGENSELYEAVQLAFLNGAGQVYALPVEETEATDSVTSAQTGTVDNAPVMDPNIHPEHTIDVQDTSEGTAVDVEIVYDDPTSPSAADTMQFNPNTGEFEADASSDYEITYTYGDYSATAMAPLLDEEPRIVAALTENTSIANTLAGELNSRATDFTFMHGIAGASPTIDDVSNFSNSIDERRLSLVYPARGYTDAGEQNEVRTTAAVAGHLAGLALGLSSTNNELGGFQSVRGELAGPADAGELSDEGIMPLLDYPPLTIVIDMTTSSEPKFERVYAMQVVDEATELSHQISREYVGEQNTQTQRNNLRRAHRNAFLEMIRGSPQMLDDFTVAVTEDAADDNQTNVDITINVVDVMDTVDVTMTVGDIVRTGGAI